MAKRKKNRQTQSKLELLQHLSEHTQFMQMSLSAFDKGFVGEAKRLAVSLRVILHQTNNSHSLLRQLKVQSGFYDTAHDYDPKNLMTHHGLVGIRISPTGTQFTPHLTPERHITKQPFPKWWNKIVIVDKNKSEFSRRQLVLALANQDGGAHVDPELDQSYANLSRHNSVGWVVGNGITETPLENVELFSVRQIAHETLLTLNDLLPPVPK